MDAVLFTPNTAAQPGSSLLTAPDSGQVPGSGSDFGAIFNSMQPLLGRQDLAAVLFGQSPAIGALVSVPLGTGMAVITPEGTPPSQDSLLAFARSQGLNETAIAALWQQPAATPDTLDTLQTPGAVLATGHPAAAGSLAPAPPPGALVLGLTITPPQAQTPQDPSAPAPELDALALHGLRAQFLAQSQRTPGRTAAGPSHPTEVLTPSGMPMVRQEQPLIELDLTEDLAHIVQGSPTPSVPEGTSNPALSGLGDARSGGQALAQAAAPDNRLAQNTAAAHSTLSGYQLKVDHYQQLADRMGQALAQRMLEQIDRGQWSMKIRLNPAELGQIDVRLEMRQSGLDAHFQAENPLTKELIQQGSGRLKDNLGQNGMTLASMSVSSDAGRQSSGNPTPQQEQRQAAPDQQIPQAQADAVPTPLPKKTAADGWDMLA